MNYQLSTVHNFVCCLEWTGLTCDVTPWFDTRAMGTRAHLQTPRRSWSQSQHGPGPVSRTRVKKARTLLLREPSQVEGVPSVQRYKRMASVKVARFGVSRA